MASFLTMQLFAPLVSWGDVAVGEERPSLPHPTKSAILGIVAAALGYDRAAEQQHGDLHRRFRIGFRIDHSGSLLADWQTVQTIRRPELQKLRKANPFFTRYDLLKSRNPYTITSRRFYFVDALAATVLEDCQRSDPALAQIAERLERPHFAPYLGRRCCSPALPFAPRVIEANSLFDALNSFEGDQMYRKVYQSLGKATERTRTLLWEADDAEGSTATLVRRDGLISRSRWQFTERRIYRRDQEVEDVSQ